jgi:glutamate racemase
MKIGVFDSGVGGLSVVRAIEAALPDHEVIFASDTEHIPYGTKPPAEVLGYVVPILEGLIAKGCDVLVIACNTVTTHHAPALRSRFSIPIIGIEPMVKPAAKLTKSGVIAVCATPSTLASGRYDWLKRTYAAGLSVIEPDCSQWTSMIEAERVNEMELDAMVDSLIGQGADVIVLGCTHYHWIEREITSAAAGRAAVVQPESAVVRQLKRIIATPAPPA